MEGVDLPFPSSANRGKRKAIVLPEPVWAAQSTSLPPNTRGIACFWMGVGLLYRILLRLSAKKEGSALA